MVCCFKVTMSTERGFRWLRQLHYVVQTAPSKHQTHEKVVLFQKRPIRPRSVHAPFQNLRDKLELDNPSNCMTTRALQTGISTTSSWYKRQYRLELELASSTEMHHGRMTSPFVYDRPREVLQSSTIPTAKHTSRGTGRVSKGTCEYSFFCHTSEESNVSELARSWRDADRDPVSLKLGACTTNQGDNPIVPKSPSDTAKSQGVHKFNWDVQGERSRHEATFASTFPRCHQTVLHPDTVVSRNQRTGARVPERSAALFLVLSRELPHPASFSHRHSK